MTFHPENAVHFVTEIPQGTAERVYASDYNLYCRRKYLFSEEDAPRPYVGEYGIGSRVAEYIRNNIYQEDS